MEIEITRTVKYNRIEYSVKVINQGKCSTKKVFWAFEWYPLGGGKWVRSEFTCFSGRSINRMEKKLFKIIKKVQKFLRKDVNLQEELNKRNLPAIEIIKEGYERILQH